MPPLSEMARNARTFLENILPVSCYLKPPLKLDELKKQFQWALYCEKLVNSLQSSGKWEDFKKLLKNESDFDLLKNACRHLLESYMYANQWNDQDLLQVCAVAREFIDKENLSSIFESISVRNAVYRKSLALVQGTSISRCKSLLLKENLSNAHTNVQFVSKLEEMVHTLAGMELLINLILTTDNSEDLTSKILNEQVVQFLHGKITEWLQDSTGNSGVINSLLATSVRLTRQMCVQNPAFLELWLKVLASLASNLQLHYFGNSHDWIWPGNEDATEGKFQGVWFAFSQLSRHFTTLLDTRDQVAETVDKFLEEQQNKVNGAVWIELSRILANKL